MNFTNNPRCLIFLLLFPFLSIHGKSYPGSCADSKNGIYKMHSRDGSLHTIIRNNNLQTETSGRTANVIQSNIQWTSDCSFYLYNRCLLRGSDSLNFDFVYDTLYNVITEANNSWETITSTYHDSTFVTNYFKLDTTKMYTDLQDMEQFKEYKGGQSSGTFSTYNYVISCVQHPVDKSKYLMAFEEALLVGATTKYKLLDYIFCTLDSNLRIATVNCRYDDLYDKEVVALYYSNNKKGEAIIIKSWRFSKAALKIVELPVQEVKYKESDKYLIIWDEQILEKE